MPTKAKRHGYPKRESRASAHKRGYTKLWQKLSEAHKRANPLCVECLKEGKVTPVFATDHIVPHKGDRRLFFDQSNWQSLCEGHHNAKSRNE